MERGVWLALLLVAQWVTASEVAVPGWYRGTVGQSCNVVCQANGFFCHEGSMRGVMEDVDTQAEFEALFQAAGGPEVSDFACNTVETGTSGKFPYTPNRVCVWSATQKEYWQVGHHVLCRGEQLGQPAVAVVLLHDLSAASRTAVDAPIGTTAAGAASASAAALPQCAAPVRGAAPRVGSRAQRQQWRVQPIQWRRGSVRGAL